MKKIKSLAIMAVIMMTTMFSLTSCDKDSLTAWELDGIWEGTVSSDYFSHRGISTSYTSVQIEFIKDTYRGGYGYEYDYTYGSIYGHKYRFTYEVKNDVIYIDYDDGSHVAIYDYRLNGRYFSGRFCDERTGAYLATFNFTNTDNWYYAKPGFLDLGEGKSGPVDLDSTTVK